MLKDLDLTHLLTLLEHMSKQDHKLQSMDQEEQQVLTKLSYTLNGITFQATTPQVVLQLIATNFKSTTAMAVCLLKLQGIQLCTL